MAEAILKGEGDERMDRKFLEYCISQQERQALSVFQALYFDRIGFFENARAHKASRMNPDFYMVFLCVKGKGYLDLQDRRHAISAGDVFFTFPHIPHTYGAEDDDPWSIYWAHFYTADASFAEILRESQITVLQPKVRSPRAQEIADPFQTILSGIYSATIHEHRYKQSVFAQMLFKILLLSENSGRKDPLVARALEYIQDNWSAYLSLDQISDALGVSKYHLSHVFTRTMGVSIKQYILMRRLDNAKFLLESTDKSIGEIAELCAYESATYFSNAFKKYTARSPQNYRKLFWNK